MTEKGGRGKPRLARPEASLDDPADALRLHSFANELGALDEALETIRDPQRLARRVLDPLGSAGVELRYGRMVIRRSAGERAALRREGNLKDLAADAWRSFLLDDLAGVDWFLGLMNLPPSGAPGKERTREDLRRALYDLLDRQWASRPARLNHVSPAPWYDPASPFPERHLKKTIRMDAHKLWTKRARARSAKGEEGHDALFSRPGGEEILEAEHPSALIPAEEGFAVKEWVRSAQLRAKTAEHGFTPRQAEVIGLLIRGMSNAEIAAEMGIAPVTVRVTRRNIAAKVERADAC